MSEYLSRIKKLIADKTGLETSEINGDCFFEEDLNLGEMEVIEILSELEEIYHVNLVDDIGNFATVQDVVDALEEHIQ